MVIAEHVVLVLVAVLLVGIRVVILRVIEQQQCPLDGGHAYGSDGEEGFCVEHGLHLECVEVVELAGGEQVRVQRVRLVKPEVLDQ